MATNGGGRRSALPHAIQHIGDRAGRRRGQRGDDGVVHLLEPSLIAQAQPGKAQHPQQAALPGSAPDRRELS